MKNGTLRFALAVVAALFQIQAQTAASAGFAAASIKADHSDNFQNGGIHFLPGGRLDIVNVPLFMIVAAAYDLPFQSGRLSGGPGWIRSDRFDIEATADKGAIPQGASSKVRDDKMRAMLQALLVERFHLKIRREMKDQPVYAIVPGKDGPKLQPAGMEEKDCDASAAKGIACHVFMGGRGRGLHAKAADMTDLALFVANWTDRPLVDKTGLRGLFQFETRGWAVMAPGPEASAGAKAEDGQDLASLPTIFTIFSDMGLKLDSQKAPVEMFTIESIEKPSEN